MNNQHSKSRMKRKYTAIIEKSKDGVYISQVVELPGCHTQAKSIDDLIKRTKEVIMVYLAGEEEQEFSTFVGVKQIEV